MSTHTAERDIVLRPKATAIVRGGNRTLLGDLTFFESDSPQRDGTTKTDTRVAWVGRYQLSDDLQVRHDHWRRASWTLSRIEDDPLYAAGCLMVPEAERTKQFLRDLDIVVQAAQPSRVRYFIAHEMPTASALHVESLGKVTVDAVRPATWWDQLRHPTRRQLAIRAQYVTLAGILGVVAANVLGAFHNPLVTPLLFVSVPALAVGLGTMAMVDPVILVAIDRTDGTSDVYRVAAWNYPTVAR